jgi:hypothetical protein
MSTLKLYLDEKKKHGERKRRQGSGENVQRKAFTACDSSQKIIHTS